MLTFEPAGRSEQHCCLRAREQGCSSYCQGPARAGAPRDPGIGSPGHTLRPRTACPKEPPRDDLSFRREMLSPACCHRLPWGCSQPVPQAFPH